MKTRIIQIIKVGAYSNLVFIPVLVFILAVNFSGCHEKTKTATELNTQILTSHAWKLQSLTVDNTDKTSLYSGMTLSFTDTNYTSTHGEPVWAASGTWSFTGPDGTSFIRNDQIEVEVVSIADDKLVLSLNWTKTTYGSGREASVSGNHVYTFIK